MLAAARQSLIRFPAMTLQYQAFAFDKTSHR